MSRETNKISVVEAAYLPARTETEWLQTIATAAAPIVSEGFGAIAYVYEGAQGRLRPGSRASVGFHLPIDVFVDPIADMDPAFVDRTWRTLTFGLCSESMDLSKLPHSQPLCAAGIRDVFNVNAYDPSGVGVMLAAPLPSVRKRHAGEAQAWTRVAAHIASAFRLRRRTKATPTPDTATALLETNGRIAHACNGPMADRSREKLRDAVLRMERARGPMRRRDPDGAVELWRTLVDAELTLLDHFERGGKRYVIAVANPNVDEGDHEALPRRERQVVAAAAAGRTNKLIAYELGLAHSTVRVLLARAARRFGAKSRRELVAIHRAHERARTP
jgi:DNA-binding CsgD family transcriptional regulator